MSFLPVSQTATPWLPSRLCFSGWQSYSFADHSVFQELQLWYLHLLSGLVFVHFYLHHHIYKHLKKNTEVHVQARNIPSQLKIPNSLSILGINKIKGIQIKKYQMPLVVFAPFWELSTPINPQWCVLKSHVCITVIDSTTLATAALVQG